MIVVDIDQVVKRTQIAARFIHADMLSFDNRYNGGIMDKFEQKAQTRQIMQPEAKKEVHSPIETAVVKKRCKVVSYNKNSHILVYERDGNLIQTNAIHDYDGSGFIEVE